MVLTSGDDGSRPASMLDVARLAGVSQKTVSRVVNREAHVSDAVRERVLAAIADLRYLPNAAAQALASQRTRRLGMVTIGTSLFGPAAILDGIESAAREAGYALTLARTVSNTLDELSTAIEKLVAQGIDGLVVSEPGTERRASAHPSLSIPTLWLDSPSLDYPDDDIVIGPDERDAARRATEHLLSLGHRTVWHIAGNDGWSATWNRVNGWRDALERAGAPVPPLLHGDWTPRSGYDAVMSGGIAPDATAVFAANDQMAVGAVHALENSGRSVPIDVSVVGFDDDPVSEYLHAPLTTVRQPFDQVTRLGVERLIALIEGRDAEPRQQALEAELVIRRSSAPPVG
jgi:DNA-binding LacI/PurR family transcriptional regulator